MSTTDTQASCSTALPLYVYTATIVPFSAFVLMADFTVSDFFGLDSKELLYLCIISCSHSDHSCTMISLLSSALGIIRFLTRHFSVAVFAALSIWRVSKKWMNGFHNRKQPAGDVLEGDEHILSERDGYERGKAQHLLIIPTVNGTEM